MGEDGAASWHSARAAWPGVDVSQEQFAAYVAERRDSAKTGPGHVTLRESDLYLACACARGDTAAIRAFEQAFFGEIRRCLKRIGGSTPPALDEVEQLVRHKLFVAEAGGRPRIAEYGGRGDLRSWFRVTVSRLVLNLATRKSPEVPVENDLLTCMLGGQKPDFELAKEAYKEDFRVAFRETFDSLSDRDRSLLRYAFGEELTVDAIGALYGVHKTTAARWVVRAHEALLDGVQKALMARLGISADEYASVLRAVHSRLELSLERYLGPPPV